MTFSDVADFQIGRFHLYKQDIFTLRERCPENSYCFLSKTNNIKHGCRVSSHHRFQPANRLIYQLAGLCGQMGEEPAGTVRNRSRYCRREPTSRVCGEVSVYKRPTADWSSSSPLSSSGHSHADGRCSVRGGAAGRLKWKWNVWCAVESWARGRDLGEMWDCKFSCVHDCFRFKQFLWHRKTKSTIQYTPNISGPCPLKCDRPLWGFYLFI